MPVLWPVLGLPQACWTWDRLWLHWRLMPHPHMMFSKTILARWSHKTCYTGPNACWSYGCAQHSLQYELSATSWVMCSIVLNTAVIWTIPGQ